MHAAAGEGAMAVAKYFVEKGVSCSVKNAEGFTPLVSARLLLSGGGGGAY